MLKASLARARSGATLMVVDYVYLHPSELFWPDQPARTVDAGFADCLELVPASVGHTGSPRQMTSAYLVHRPLPCSWPSPRAYPIHQHASGFLAHLLLWLRCL